MLRNHQDNSSYTQSWPVVLSGSIPDVYKRQTIETVNFLQRAIDEPFVDLVITSPPYVTSYAVSYTHLDVYKRQA